MIMDYEDELEELVDPIWEPKAFLQKHTTLECKDFKLEEEELHLPPPSIRVSVSAGHTQAQLEAAAAAIAAAAMAEKEAVKA